MDLDKRVKDQLAAVQKALATARTGVAEIRRMIADLQQEREKTRVAPVPITEAIAAIDQMLQRWRLTSQEHVPDLSALVGVAAHGAPPQLLDPYAVSPGAVLRLTMLLLGDQVRERLLAELDAFYATTAPGLPHDARAARLREIDRELAGLEQAEEVAIAAAEEGGLMIDRRPDVSPAVVLGLE